MIDGTPRAQGPSSGTTGGCIEDGKGFGGEAADVLSKSATGAEDVCWTLFGSMEKLFDQFELFVCWIPFGKDHGKALSNLFQGKAVLMTEFVNSRYIFVQDGNLTIVKGTTGQRKRAQKKPGRPHFPPPGLLSVSMWRV
jgi:hypothetical protein